MKKFLRILLRILGSVSCAVSIICLLGTIFFTGDARLGGIILLITALMSAILFFIAAAALNSPKPDAQPTRIQQPIRAQALTQTSDSQCRTFLHKLRAADDNITDERVSRDIREIANYTRQIFASAGSADPGKRRMITRFADYYLPTTLKLLSVYSDLQNRGIETSSVERTRMKIEDSLCDVKKAFRTLFENLMQSTYLDVSSEIQTMENLFHAHGLLDDGSNFSASHTSFAPHSQENPVYLPDELKKTQAVEKADLK